MTTSAHSRSQIAVIGSTSMVGSRFCRQAKKNYAIVAGDLNGKIRVDITKKKTVEDFIKSYTGDWVILFSAYTDVNGAESQRDDKSNSCWKINVLGAKNVAEACRKYGKKLIFISTDFVFDGTKGPYAEDDKPGGNRSKMSWYGISKLEAENIVKTLKNHVIIRISYPYRTYFEPKTDFARNIVLGLKNKNLHPMFADQQISPTFIDDVEPAISAIIDKNLFGTFHVASPSTTTPFKFANEVAKKFKLDSTIIKTGSLIDFINQGNTPRPISGGLKTDKIKSLGFVPTDWKEGIKN